MDRPILAVLHGWGHDARSWSALKEQIAGYEVRLVDMPGFGSEPLQHADWGIPEYAQWVERTLASYQRPVVLLGHSFGGRVAAALAAKQPSWLTGLILSGAPLLYRPSWMVQVKGMVSRFLKPLVPEHAREKLRSAEFREAKRRGMDGIFSRAVTYDQAASLPCINVPTLFLWGERDADASVLEAREAARLIPQSRFEVIPDAGHNAHLEQPILFHAMVKRFADSI